MPPLQGNTGIDASAMIAGTTMGVTIAQGLLAILCLCWGGEREKQPPFWVRPVAALILGQIVMALLSVAAGIDLTNGQHLALAMLSGFMTSISCIGVDRMHELARPQPGQVGALAAFPGATAPAFGAVPARRFPSALRPPGMTPESPAFAPVIPAVIPGAFAPMSPPSIPTATPAANTPPWMQRRPV